MLPNRKYSGSKNSRLIWVTYTEVPGQPPYALIPTGEHTFAFRDLEGYSMEFMTEEDGSIGAVKFNQPNGVFTAKRKE